MGAGAGGEATRVLMLLSSSSAAFSVRSAMVPLIAVLIFGIHTAPAAVDLGLSRHTKNSFVQSEPATRYLLPAALMSWLR